VPLVAGERGEVLLGFPRRLRHAAAALLVTQSVVSAPARTVHGPVLSVQGDRFALDGAPRFLIFVSYFDALRADPRSRDADLDFFQRHGISGVRIFPNWSHYGCPAKRGDDDSLVTRGGGLNAGTLQRLKEFMTAASARKLVVDVTFTRDTLSDQQRPELVEFNTYKAGIEAAATALVPFRNALFDVQNEWTVHGGLSEGQIKDLIAAVHAKDPRRVVSGSTENADADAGRFAAASGSDFTAHHDDRERNWHERVATVVHGLRGGLSKAAKPIYLQEPSPFTAFCDGQRADGNAAHHHAALRNAVKAGAAAWTFHTRTGFVLSKKGFVDRASDAEKKAIAGLAGLR
jgi:hypothetical protein